MVSSIVNSGKQSIEMSVFRTKSESLEQSSQNKLPTYLKTILKTSGYETYEFNQLHASFASRKKCEGGVLCREGNYTIHKSNRTRSISLNNFRTKVDLCHTLQKAMDLSDTVDDTRRKHCNSIRGKKCKAEITYCSSAYRSPTVQTLQAKVRTLRRDVQTSRRKTSTLTKKIKSIRENARNCDHTSSFAIVSLKREIDSVEDCLSRAKIRKNICKRNRDAFVKSLKHAFSDVPDDRIECESESEWEINTKISLLKNMQAELRNSRLAIRAARHLKAASSHTTLATCVALSIQESNILSSVLCAVCNFANKVTEEKLSNTRRPLPQEMEK